MIHTSYFMQSREAIDVSIIQDNAISTGSELRKCGKRHVIPANNQRLCWRCLPA
jgi:hypothetical protein